MATEHIHFVTGRLASHSLQQMLPELSNQAGFEYSVGVLPITVAALMTPDWIAKHLDVPAHAHSILLPGYCQGDMTRLEAETNLPVRFGPKDLRKLPQYFLQPSQPDNYGAYDIEIIAEINHCPRLPLAEILTVADELFASGADVIDLGCDPGVVWRGITETVRVLKERGYRVSIDSLNPQEIATAASAGAELVLSVNSTNRQAAPDWGVEVVAIPDDPKNLTGLDDTVQFLASKKVPFRIDPILEPIGFGFSASLERYLQTRRRYPEAEIMMGIGNLTELTDADSAGINVLLLGFCQEVGIRSVLTTQVINWARSSVRECDLARKLTHYAVHEQVLPKHVEPQLIMLRDELLVEPTIAEIHQLANDVRDNNYRIFTAEGEIHLISHNLHLYDADPFVVMEQLLHSGPDGGVPKNLDPSHAFYLGYEMNKARIALNLGKTYTQDESLDWGLATQPETRHYLKHRGRGKTY